MKKITTRPLSNKPHPPPTKIRNPMPTKRRGEVAEAAFLHKAASMGFSVSKPWGESDRYDFILDHGGRCSRVQVKSAHCDGRNGYTFHACGNAQSQTYTAKDIDFLVAYVVPEDVWYVLPIAVFKSIQGVKMFPSSKRRMSKFEKYREAWGLIKADFSEPKLVRNDKTGEAGIKAWITNRTSQNRTTLPNHYQPKQTLSFRTAKLEESAVWCRQTKSPAPRKKSRAFV